jgi:hypothetical protein
MAGGQRTEQQRDLLPYDAPTLSIRLTQTWLTDKYSILDAETAPLQDLANVGVRSPDPLKNLGSGNFCQSMSTQTMPDQAKTIQTLETILLWDNIPHICQRNIQETVAHGNYRTTGDWH